MHNYALDNQKPALPVPDKLFYKIGEVSKITGIESYVLRYWETEFPFLRPRKNKSGQRVYTRKELELIIRVKTMLYQDRYTIEGVRKKFSECGIRGEDVAIRPERRQGSPKSHAETIGLVKRRLQDILRQIS